MSNQRIDNIRKYIPKWMAMSNKEDSVGYKFLKCFGMELDMAKAVLDDLQNSLYIHTAGREIPSHVYKTELYTAEDEFEVAANIEIVDSIYKFFNVDYDAALIDYEKKIMYVNNSIENLSITIYDIKKDQNGDAILDGYGNRIIDSEEISYNAQLVLHHIWNAFDEFALLLGMQRLYGESNDSLKSRIIDCLSIMPGSNHEPLVSGIARELGIDKTKVSAIPLCEVEQYDETDQISEEFSRYVDKMRAIFDVSSIRWDESLGALSKASLDYMPVIYDSSMSKFQDQYIQSGIGDGDDLLVEAPEVESDKQEFRCRVALRGKIKNVLKFYPRHKFKYRIYAEGKKLNSSYTPKDIVLTIGASEKAPLSFSVEADQEYDRSDYSDLQSSEMHNVECVPSNTIISPDNRYIKIVATMTSNITKSASPTVSQIKINYKKTGDSADYSKTLTLDVSNDNVDTSESSIKISKHTYSREYKEPVAWLLGVRNGLEITSQGLKLPKA